MDEIVRYTEKRSRIVLNETLEMVGVQLSQKIKKHYEKIICACCFLILFTNIGLPSTSFSVYQPYLVAIPEVGHSGGSIIISIRTFVSLLAMFFVARFYRIFDCRLGVFIASLCVGLGFALYALFADCYPGLCVASIFTGLGYGLGGMVASTMLISRWFASHMASAAGIAAVGSGVAAMVLPSLVVEVINATSLSVAFALESALACFVGVVVFVLLKNRPEDIDRSAYVAPEKKTRTKGHTKTHAKRRAKGRIKEATSKQVRVNRDLPHALLPVVFVAMVFVGSASVGGSNYLAVLFTSEGFSTEYAALLVAIVGACLTFSKLFTGIVFDKIGTRYGSLVFFVLFILGIALLCISAMGNTAVVGLSVVLYGLGLSLGTVGISIWSIELSPKGHQMQTIKNFQIAYALGGFVFTFLPGFLAELSGSYLITYLILFGMLVVAGIIIVAIYTHLDRRASE